jgi:hypothetical protein
MAERAPRNRPRVPRRTPPPSVPEEVQPLPRAIAPSAYREHLEREHGVTIVAEPGWPTEYKRYRLVRAQDGTQRSLAVFRGTLAEATTHFYYLLHPEQRPRR